MVRNPAQKEGLMLGMVRKLRRYSDEKKKGDWRRDWGEKEEKEKEKEK